MCTSTIDLTVEFRFANGSSSVFQEYDEARIGEALRLLAAPQLFAQPHLLVASEHCARMIPCKGVDMILARTRAPLPLKFPLDHPAGSFDFVEPSMGGADTTSAEQVMPIGRAEQQRQRNSRVEIHTLGGWAVTVAAMATFRGNLQDERQFFSLLPGIPTVPYRLADGGFGLVNTMNIVCLSASPRPETLPKNVLPLTGADRSSQSRSGPEARPELTGVSV
jgi:hypothetical protein